MAYGSAMNRRIPYRVLVFIAVGIIVIVVVWQLTHHGSANQGSAADRVVWAAADKTKTADALRVQITIVPMSTHEKTSTAVLNYHAPDTAILTNTTPGEKASDAVKHSSGKAATALLSTVSDLSQVSGWHKQGRFYVHTVKDQTTVQDGATVHNVNRFTVSIEHGYVVLVIHQSGVSTSAGSGIGTTVHFLVTSINGRPTS
jgi:hypothetical protein